MFCFDLFESQKRVERLSSFKPHLLYLTLYTLLMHLLCSHIIIIPKFEISNIKYPSIVKGWCKSALEATGKLEELRPESQSHILPFNKWFFLEAHALKSNNTKLSILLGLVFPHISHLKLLLLGHTNSTTNKEKRGELYRKGMKTLRAFFVKSFCICLSTWLYCVAQCAACTSVSGREAGSVVVCGKWTSIY